MSRTPSPQRAPAPEDDRTLMDGVVRRDPAAFERLMRTHNSRLFRVARAILRSDSDAEDALQDAYLDAFRHAASFRADSSLATWLTRIVINQSLMRRRRQNSDPVVVRFGDGSETSAEYPDDGRPDQRSSIGHGVPSGSAAAARTAAGRAAGRVPHGVRDAGRQ